MIKYNIFNIRLILSVKKILYYNNLLNNENNKKYKLEYKFNYINYCNIINNKNFNNNFFIQEKKE